MKSFIGFASVALVASAAVAVSPPAQADPYPGTVATSCSVRAVQARVPRGKTAKIRVKVRENSTRNVRAGVTIKITKNGRRISKAKRYYPGRATTFKLGRFKAGKYKVKISTSIKASSQFRNCSGRARFRVKS